MGTLERYPKGVPTSISSKVRSRFQEKKRLVGLRCLLVAAPEQARQLLYTPCHVGDEKDEARIPAHSVLTSATRRPR